MKHTLIIPLLLLFVLGTAQSQVVQVINGQLIRLQPGQASPSTTFTFLAEPKMVDCPGFEYIWGAKTIFSRSNYMLTVAQVAAPPVWTNNNRQITVSLNLIEAVTEQKHFKKSTVKAKGNAYTSRASQNNNKKILESGKYYLLLLYNYKALRGQGWSNTGWRIYGARIQANNTPRTYSTKFAMPISGPNDPIIKVIKRLVLNQQFSDKTKELPEIALEYLNSPDKQTRNFTARLAAANGLSFSERTPGKLRNAYAQLILDAKDPLMSITLARGYYQAALAKEMYFPEDAKLMESLLDIKDTNIVSQVVLGFYSPSIDLKKYAPYIEQMLAEQNRPGLRSTMLYVMRNWANKAGAFKEPLQKIAKNQKGYISNKTNAFNRVAAYDLLKTLKTKDIEQTGHNILNHIPSAVILNDMASRNDRAAIPFIVEAINKKTYPMTPAVRLTLMILSSQHKIANPGDFMAWWKPIRKSKEYHAMIKTGFLTQKQQNRACQLVDQLGSTQFAKRNAAKEALLKMGLPIPDALRKAKDFDEPEITLAAEQIIKAVKASEVPYRQQLANLAKRERQTGEINWAAYKAPPQPTTQPKRTPPHNGPIIIPIGGNRLIPVQAGGAQVQILRNAPAQKTPQSKPATRPVSQPTK